MAGFFFCRVGSHYWQRRGLRLWTIAFAAVPDVLKKGRLVDTQKNWKGRGYNGASIAAPIRIGNTDYIAVAVVLQDVNQNRFYLHEVALKEKLQGPAFKTEALTTKRGALNGADQPGVIKKLLINIFSVNPDEVSKAVDANGEPLATEALFEQLDAGAASGSNPDLLMQSNEIAQEQLQREINPVIYTAAEFNRRVGAGEPFVSNLLANPILFIIGTQHDLGKLAGHPPAPAV